MKNDHQNKKVVCLVINLLVVETSLNFDSSDTSITIPYAIPPTQLPPPPLGMDLPPPPVLSDLPPPIVPPATTTAPTYVNTPPSKKAPQTPKDVYHNNPNPKPAPPSRPQQQFPPPPVNSNSYKPLPLNKT